MEPHKWWLMKSEPDVFGINHLKAEGSTLCDGIRNYQARNFMLEMQVGPVANLHFPHEIARLIIADSIPQGAALCLEVAYAKYIWLTFHQPPFLGCHCCYLRAFTSVRKWLPRCSKFSY